MSDFEAKGYEDLREYLVSADGWNYVGLVDDTGTIEAVIDIANDARVDWSVPSDNPVVAHMDLAGSNSDINTPVELQGTALYASSTDATEGDSLIDTDPTHEDQFEEANVILDEEDKLEIEHRVELPEVV